MTTIRNFNRWAEIANKLILPHVTGTNPKKR
jgi:hypothetical protein